MKYRILAFLAAAACLVVVFAGGTRSAETRPNLILICVDTLRADHMSLYGYERPTTPQIDRWFAEATIFERAYTAEANTTPSVISLLTGQYPQNHGVRLLFQKIPSDLVTLPVLLSKAGYETAGIVSNMVLTSEACGLDAQFDHFDDYISESVGTVGQFERTAGPTTDAALDFVEFQRDSRRPFFLYVHYMDPHGPYTPPEDKPADFAHDATAPLDHQKLDFYQRLPGIRDALEMVDLYDEEIAYADREIGRLLDELKTMGVLENAILIFTSDHGESMMDHEVWFAHGYHVYEPLIHVPLMVIGEGFPARRVSTAVSLVDVAPMVLTEAGLPVPAHMDGRALTPEPESVPCFVESTHLASQKRAVIHGDRKWVREILSKGEPQHAGVTHETLLETFNEVRWTFRLDTDPGELLRYPWEPAPAAESLLALIAADPSATGIPQQYATGMAPDAPKVAPGIDPEMRKKLEALGYVGR